MNKRQRFLPLGASEFAAILNGEDTNAIQNALRRFVQTVREERRIAVGDSSLDDEKSSESSSSASDEDEPAQKKQKFRKEETWKEDTANYEVPFVGTSVAKGDIGRVVAGEWPTGLLKAYVEKSPRAVEFSHLLPGGPIHKTLLRRKHGRTWHKIQKLYLQAVAELITAAVPLENIKNDAIPSQSTTAEDSSSRQLVDSLVSTHFSGWCLLLKEETGNGKGKAAIVGGCGQLAPYIIRIIHRLSRISSEKARQVLRETEQSISEHVMRFLLKKPNKEWDEYEKSPRAASKIELLEWTGWLASIPDHVILSRLCSPGARERKISPGLIVMSLKDGLTDFGHDSIARAAELVIRKIRSVLLGEDSRPRKILIDIFSRDVVHNLCQISTCAPILSPKDVEDIQHFVDMAENQKEVVGAEARRLLFLLICDPEKSPLIQSIRRNLKSAKRARPLILQIIQHFMKSESGEVTKLVLRTLQVNPSLFAPLLQSIPFPDMKKTFAFIARVNLAANIILHGPSVDECLGKEGSLKTVIEDGTVLQFFLPCSLKDTIVRKALQSGNVLVVAEVLKLIVFVIKRISSYLHASHVDNKVTLEARRLGDLLKAWIPDPNMLVSILMKADTSRGPSSMVVAIRVGVVLRLLLERFPEIFFDFTFDWSKLLSKDNSFASAKSIVQSGRLETILCMLRADQLRLPPGAEAKFCYDLLHILVHTKIVKVHDLARKAVLHFLSTYLGDNDDPGGNSTIPNELCCWVDGLCAATLKDFYSVLQQALHQPYRFTLEFVKVWRLVFGDVAVPRMPFSSLMIQSLRLINKVSSHFVLLYTQVATNSLLFHNDPVALATTIKEVCRQESLTGHGVYLSQLDRFINELLVQKKSGGSGQCVALREHLRLIFSEDRHPLLHLLNRVKQCEPRARSLSSFDDLSVLGWEDLTSLVRQGSNPIVSRDECWEALSKELKCVVPSLTLKSSSFWDTCTSLSIQKDHLDVVLVSGMSWAADRCIEVDAESIHTVLSDSLAIASHTALVDVRQQLYHLYFICPYLPPFLLGELLCQLVDESKREFYYDPMYCTLTATVLDAAAKAIDQLEGAYAMCGNVASRIVELWLNSGSSLDTTEIGALIRSADNGVFQMISGSNLATSFTLCELSKQESTRVVARCLQGGVNDQSKGKQILLALLDKEPSSYSSGIINSLRYSEGTDSPRFDDLVLAMKSSYLKSHEDEELLLSWQHESLKRSVSDIADAEAENFAHSFERFSRISEEVNDSQALFFALSRFIEKCSSSTKTCKLRLTKLIDVTLRICLSNHGESAQEVASQAFLLLSDHVAQSVRSFIRKLDTHNENTKSRAAEAIEAAITLLTSSVDFDLHYLKESGKESLTNAVKACLRLGLRPVEGEANILCAKCLKLVQSYVSAIQTKKLSGVFSAPEDFVDLVFEMASTHSNFHELMRSGTDEIARQELLNLLLVCLGSGGNLSFDKEVWQTLLYTFDCGMSPTDLILRKIIKHYGMLEKEVDKPLVTINQSTWGVSNATPMQPAGSFLNALEMYRIQASLCDFPLHDSIDPFMIETNQGLESQKPFSKDDRYSPGYLLPLALSHLELTMDIDHVSLLVDTGNITLEAVDLAQRYCERGVAALCFMALASDCITLRRTGVAILGLLSFLAGSKVALESGTWRSRPQLAMLFDAFRRAMVIFYQEKELAMQCPQLPSLSVLFLARASLVLSHPGDDLYANINRVFLRIEKDHGAFQDLWRLPAFITLFCSAADDHDKLLEERMFALLLVRDGFLNEMCYKPLHACHGIELILSSFYNYRLRSRNDKQDELVVLMESLERIVTFGGTRSKDHLFKRLGLLSFWRSLILARSFTGFIHTSKERDAFLSCLRACLIQAASVMTREDFSLATEGLWQPLLEFFLELIASDISLACLCLSTLDALRYSSDEDVTVLPPISTSGGVVFSTATKLLTVFGEVKELPFSVVLCAMPLCTSHRNTDEEYAAIFCLEVLRLAIHKGMDVHCVLMRIASIIEWFDSPTFDKNDELLKALLKCRCEVGFNEGVLSKWQKCISALLKSPDNDNGQGASAFRRLTQDLIQERTHS